MHVDVNYKHVGPEISTAIKKMEKHTINIPDTQDNSATMVDLFSWESD